jgi:hypothetical protein
MKVAWKVRAITSANGPPATCIVQDVSAGGARLRVPDDIELPDRFSLFLPLKRQTQAVVVRWRDPATSEIGVAFVATEEPCLSAAPAVTSDLGRIYEQIELLESEFQKISGQLAALKLAVARVASPVAQEDAATTPRAA